MKKIIDKFLKLDNTRKIVISFVCISFISILIITVFNMFHVNTVSVEAKFMLKQPVMNENKEKNKEDKEDKNATTNHSTSTNSNENQVANNEYEKESNPSSAVTVIEPENTQLPDVEMVNASISIIGMNNDVIASGNVIVEKGQSVYDGLQKFADENKIAISVNLPGKYAYITSIAGLHERQHGANSGWLYQVNGVTPNLGSGHIKINQDDQIIWYYTYD